jgi:hypothetical protein
MLPRSPARLRLLAPLAVSALLLGCGGGSTHRVSGKVTFKGAPIKAGMIYFTPDGSKDNKGPTGFAVIVDGKYDTAAEGGSGAVKGPMIVAIEGTDPDTQGKANKGDPTGEILVTSLFPRYETSIDLPGSDTTKDFDVPAEATKGPKKGPIMIVP